MDLLNLEIVSTYPVYVGSGMETGCCIKRICTANGQASERSNKVSESYDGPLPLHLPLPFFNLASSDIVSILPESLAMTGDSSVVTSLHGRL
ncbi:hypothetical protein EVAR_46305_1 [Eumeta japonica]|uniref:Uncharacterized protein n=1 Tax=Eumeta variegata TaxID=151549 RepID=A0A4C1XZZ9_EUMVA|nr:hypothetical protein EVAR_46305_1 [Eumeta japonica]